MQTSSITFANIGGSDAVLKVSSGFYINKTQLFVFGGVDVKLKCFPHMFIILIRFKYVRVYFSLCVKESHFKMEFDRNLNH